LVWVGGGGVKIQIEGRGGEKDGKMEYIHKLPVLIDLLVREERGGTGEVDDLRSIPKNI